MDSTISITAGTYTGTVSGDPARIAEALAAANSANPKPGAAIRWWNRQVWPVQRSKRDECPGGSSRQADHLYPVTCCWTHARECWDQAAGDWPA